MFKTRTMYLALIFACSLAGIYPYLMGLNSPRLPSPALATSGAEQNNVAAESFVHGIHEFTQLDPLGWDGCMKYRCNEEEKCTQTTSSLPCCEDLLYRMAVDIDKLLLAFNATSFPFSGTLLGIIREGSVTPNNINADVDFLVDSISFQNIYVNPMGILMRYAFYMAGYHLFPDGSDLGRVCFRKNSQMGLLEETRPENIKAVHGQDGWMYYNNYKYGDLYRTEYRDSTYFYIFASTNFPKGLRLNDIYPMRSVKIKDHVFKIPLRSEEMLSVMYGNWKEVVKGLHHG